MGDGLDGGLLGFGWIIWLFVIALGLFLIGAFYMEYQESHTVYEMPNGIICDLKIMRGGGAFSSASTFEFKQCEDGEIYVNPESFLEIKK